MSFFKSALHKYIAIIIFLIAWQILPTLGLVNQIFVPTPTAILAEMWRLSADGTLQFNAIISLWRVFAGFGIALLVALPLGFLLGGFFKNFEKAVNPLLQLLSQANPFTLFPIFIVFLGIGELSKISIIYWVTQWPILLNTITGISNVDPVLVKMAKSSGLSKAAIFTKVLIPASLPTVFTGIRMGAVFAFFMLIGAEMLGSTSGLGHMIMQAQMVMQIPKMWAGIVTVALLGYLVNYVILYLERRVSTWKQDVEV
ncbi:putative aliphatic sulfonates transport permease protein SsuC [Methanobrevibacter cuticularis]|uniref:Putative aliphatic sulfonates transport permease protein SsuC n=1 Tax=Methanobrevibacter cuticularis TaxID=47311 RepID=A0A166CRX1_9EURY|nr:ABC transporter permease [Methanobrevibacter cuticularis]KZX14799.1 putative aliphatic sulfonates transport permease protein SsuC [Methanobrevibacter cuticularis]